MELRLEIEVGDRGRSEVIEIAVKAFELFFGRRKSRPHNEKAL